MAAAAGQKKKSSKRRKNEEGKGIQRRVVRGEGLCLGAKITSKTREYCLDCIGTGHVIINAHTKTIHCSLE